MALPDLSILSIHIGSPCKDGAIEEQFKDSCFFYATISALKHAFKPFEADVLTSMLSFIHADDHKSCVTTGLPTSVSAMYRKLVLAEWESGIVLNLQAQAWQDVYNPGFTQHYTDGVTQKGLNKELELRHTVEYKELVQEAQECIGWKTEAALQEQYKYEAEHLDQGGESDIMALALLLASNVPMIYYTLAAPSLLNSSDIAISLPKTSRLMMTNLKRQRYTPSPYTSWDTWGEEVIHVKECLEAFIDNAVSSSRKTRWPDRKLLSGIVDVYEILIDGKEPRMHAVAIFPCESAGVYRICDSFQGTCFDTVNAWLEFRQQVYGNDIEQSQVAAITLFWDSGEPQNPSVDVSVFDEATRAAHIQGQESRNLERARENRPPWTTTQPVRQRDVRSGSAWRQAPRTTTPAPSRTAVWNLKVACRQAMGLAFAAGRSPRRSAALASLEAGWGGNLHQVLPPTTSTHGACEGVLADEPTPDKETHSQRRSAHW